MPPTNRWRGAILRRVGSFWRSVWRMRDGSSSLYGRRRKSPFAKEAIEAIAAVYAIEKRVRGAEAAERRQVRQAESRPILEALHGRLVAMRDGLSRTSPLTKAIDYALDHWSGLDRFLDDGRLEPDTNVVERQIRSDQHRQEKLAVQRRRGRRRDLGDLVDLVNTAR